LAQDALSQEEIFQRKISIPPCKRTTADLASYLSIINLGPSLDFDPLIKRIALRASFELTGYGHNIPPSHVLVLG
jgi:hypothetical protein